MRLPHKIITALAFSLLTSLYGRNEFFVFDNGLQSNNLATIESQLDLVKEIGFDGLSWRTDDPERIRRLLDGAKQRGLRVQAIYVGVELKDGGISVDPRLNQIIQLCKGTDTMIWAFVTSRQFPPSSPEGDAIAVKGIQQIADLAEENGLRVALYPHFGNWMQRVDDAVRVVKKINRRNVGITFNLCHVLLMGEEKDVMTIIDRAAPYLFVATINGADAPVDRKDIQHAIQPLDRGNFGVQAVVTKLKSVGFTGPIGLQCYKIEGDPGVLLARSFAAWRKMATTP